ncbi:MAG TPA: methyltransferase domain-containing protein [Bryobacteraceae bacterium]|nr:methyltransferase domain-containing protein [Bryobacteraceae bacterium]
MTAARMFDGFAADYDRVWTHSAVGRLQREAFWTKARRYFEKGGRVLDIGCGSGEDAVRLSAAGLRVTAIDVSPSMVRLARSRGVEARVLAAEELARIEDRFDVVMSNFGALNCVRRLSAIREPLAKIVKPGGYAIFCLLGRFCLWEAAWFLLNGEASKAVRRWSGESVREGWAVRYPRVREIRSDLRPQFTLVEQCGIGVLLPPSYVSKLPARVLNFAACVDSRIGGVRGFRALGDHRLLIFRRSAL